MEVKLPFSPKFRTIEVRDRQSGAPVKIFYREAGPEDAPVLLLLHGFPSSSHQYRGLIARLSDKYRVIAPDLPGFGFSDAPDPKVFAYTFDHLAQMIEGFTDVIGLRRYALYVFDYGAPIGFRLALAHPERVLAIISQNGNAYEEGLSEGWNPIRTYWEQPSEVNRTNLRAFLQEGTTRFQYEHGASDPSMIAPESIALDQHFLDLPHHDEIQLNLFGDYKSNVAAYPSFQAYIRKHSPPILAVWGKNDPFFLPAGAEAFRRDNPDAKVRFVDAGHFPLETNLDEVATIIRAFLARTLDAEQGVALFGPLNETSVPAAARPYLDAMKDAFGFIPNLGYAIAVEPAALDAYLYVLKSIAATSLDPVAQQVAMVAASRANAADYGIAVHSTLAEKLGASRETVEALRMGHPLSDLKLEAVRNFATAIASGRTQVSDHDVRGLRAAGYDRGAAVAIALAVSAKTLVNAVAHLARPEIDAAFGPSA
ncbi:alpha/beta fold hydrolase [Bradyrhizobium sp. 83002]|nr:alpha/beta fold hydrolase [Bradyrhizobium aeschynomenes]